MLPHPPVVWRRLLSEGQGWKELGCQLALSPVLTGSDLLIPTPVLGQKFLPLAWLCDNLLISSDFKGRGNPLLIPTLSPWDSPPLFVPLFPSSLTLS